MSWLTQFWKKPRVTGAAELEAFLMAEASYLAQKSVIEYCRARAGLAWPKLMSEPTFEAALETGRWQAFAVVLADIVVVSEGFLRGAADEDRPRLAEALLTMHRRIIDGIGAPGDLHAFYEGETAGLPARLARAQLAAPHDAAEVAREAGRRIYRLMPIHPTMKTHDREVIINSVRFGMVAFRDKLATAVGAPEELVRELMAG